MLSLETTLKGALRDAVNRTFPELVVRDVHLSVGKKVADFQSAICCKLAGQLKPKGGEKPKPSLVATQLCETLRENVPSCVGSVSRNAQGFICIHIDELWLRKVVDDVNEKGPLPPSCTPQSILVDFSAPNIAKEMHVGHLRSTIIGDCICRVLEFCGHNVARTNRVGDWGTQFGMLILHLKQKFPNFCSHPPNISDLQLFYREAKQLFDTNTEFKYAAHLEVVKLQNGDKESLRAWRLICAISRKDFESIYEMLNTKLTEVGESFYNERIPLVFDELKRKELIQESEGAKIVMSFEPKAVGTLTFLDVSRIILRFLAVTHRDRKVTLCLALQNALRHHGLLENDQITISPSEKKRLSELVMTPDIDKLSRHAFSLFSPKLDRLIASALSETGVFHRDQIEVPRWSFPLIFKKSDGAATYDTTDLTAIRYRFVECNHHRVIYVTDLGQAEHFQMVAQAATDAGWITSEQSWNHAGFGLVSGEDGKKMKTRAGDTTKLRDLLDEACHRSREKIRERNVLRESFIPEEELESLANVIGIGAVKYFDLRQSRTTDYRFSYDKMLAFEGNTAVYLLYAYARLRSIQRKITTEVPELESYTLKPEERELALMIARLPDVLHRVTRELFPHHLTDYCYELVQVFTSFYSKHRVAGSPEQTHRLKLVNAVQLTLRTALDLLGVNVAERL